MSVGILGRKVGMTRVFDPEDGKAIAVTVIEAGPCPVVQVKTPETDRYSAVQLGFGRRKKANRPLQGHFRKANVEPTRYLREFRVEDPSTFRPGQVLTVSDLFAEGDLVDVTGLTKGRGFAGAMKRHGFKGRPDSHGSEKDHRRVGSIGASSFPSRVFKGQRMPGHMGVERVTVQNLRVIKADGENNLLVVKGAVPGPKNGLVVIRKAVRTAKNA